MSPHFSLEISFRVIDSKSRGEASTEYCSDFKRERYTCNVGPSTDSSYDPSAR